MKLKVNIILIVILLSFTSFTVSASLYSDLSIYGLETSLDTSDIPSLSLNNTWTGSNWFVGDYFVVNTTILNITDHISIYDKSVIEQIRLNSSGDSFFNGGNVGIGTDTPDGQFHVYGDGSTATGNKFFVEDSRAGGEWMRFSSGTAGSTMKFSDTGAFSIGSVTLKTDTSLPDDFYMGSTGTIGINIVADANVGMLFKSRGTAKDIISIIESSGSGQLFRLREDSLGSGLFSVFDKDGNEDVRFYANSDNYIMNPLSIGTTDTSYALTGGTQNVHLYLRTDASSTDTLAMEKQVASGQPQGAFLRSRASATAVIDNDKLGQFTFKGHDGTDYNNGANFGARIDGTPSANTIPTELFFGTTETNSITDRMIISPAGLVGIGDDALTPEVKLEVDGRFRVLTNSESAPTTGKGVEINIQTNGVILPVDRDTANDDLANLRIFGNDITFETGADLSVDSEKMRIQADGDVGIGTNNPLFDLHLFSDGSGNNAEMKIESDDADVTFTLDAKDDSTIVFRGGAATGNRVNFQYKSPQNTFNFYSYDLATDMSSWSVTTGLLTQFYDLIVKGNATFEKNLSVLGNFTGNQIYTEVWGHDSGVVSLEEDLYMNITNLTLGLNNGFEFNTTGNSSISPLVSGVYKVVAGWSFSGTANNEYHISISINEVQQDKCHAERVIGTGGDVGSASFTCLLDLTAGDMLHPVIENVDSSGNPTIHDINFNFWRVGN